VRTGESGDQTADTSEMLPERRFGVNRFQQNPALDELKGDIDEIGIVRQPDRVGAADASRAAQACEKIAEIVERLAVDEAAQWLID